jgi:hypothetical protein
MRFHLFAAVAASLAPLAAAGQTPADHPLRAAKVGDYATYSLANKVGNFEVKGTVTNTVKAVTDKEVTLEVTGQVNGMPIPPQTQKIDLTKPFDPAAAGVAKNAGKADVKVEKLDEGKETVTLAGKAYETTWTTLKVTTKTAAGDVAMEVKAWVGKDVPLGLGKMEMNSTVAGMAMKMQMELSEAGSKK